MGYFNTQNRFSASSADQPVRLITTYYRPVRGENSFKRLPFWQFFVLWYSRSMDIIWAIRSLIFFTAGLIVFLFPKPVAKRQIKVVGFLVRKLHINFMRHLLIDEKRVARSNFISGICFFVISIMIYSIL